MKKRKNMFVIVFPYLLFLGLIFFNPHNKFFSQNTTFTNYSNISLWLNPAETGLFYEESMRSSITQRVQEITGFVNYKTTNIFFDTKVLDGKLEASWLGLGVNAFADYSGNNTLSTQQVYISSAYHQVLGFDKIISTGASLGYISRQLDLSELQFGDQWDGSHFNLPTSDGNFLPTEIFFNVQLGAKWSHLLSKQFNYSVGISADFVNNPIDGFSYNLTEDKDNSIFALPTNFKSSIQTIFYSPKFNASFVNDLYITYQNGTFQPVVMSGVDFSIEPINRQLLIDPDEERRLYLGVGSRVFNSAFFTVGLKYKTLKVFFNYEGYLNSLSYSLGYNNAIELTLNKSFHFKKKNKVSNKKHVRCVKF